MNYHAASNRVSERHSGLKPSCVRLDRLYANQLLITFRGQCNFLTGHNLVKPGMMFRYPAACGGAVHLKVMILVIYHALKTAINRPQYVDIYLSKRYTDGNLKHI